ncbi:hypothetical protein [Azospirillum sp. sgz302134]
MPTTMPDGSVQMMAVTPQLPPDIRRPAWMQGGQQQAGIAPAGQSAPQGQPQQPAAPAQVPAGAAGPGYTVAPVPGMQKDPKFNEGETNAYGFFRRMQDAEKIIRRLEDQGAAAPGMWDRFVTILPGAVENSLHTEKYQQLDQARQDFINAQLRKESGAAIGAAEFDNAYRQYFPQPGDSPSVIEQKRANRANAIDAMMKAGKPLVDFYDKGKGGSAPSSGGVEYDWDPETKTLKLRK